MLLKLTRPLKNLTCIDCEILLSIQVISERWLTTMLGSYTHTLSCHQAPIILHSVCEDRHHRYSLVMGWMQKIPVRRD